METLCDWRLFLIKITYWTTQTVYILSSLLFFLFKSFVVLKMPNNCTELCLRLNDGGNDKLINEFRTKISVWKKKYFTNKLMHGQLHFISDSMTNQLDGYLSLPTYQLSLLYNLNLYLSLRDTLKKVLGHYILITLLLSKIYLFSMILWKWNRILHYNQYRFVWVSQDNLNTFWNSFSHIPVWLLFLPYLRF